MEGVNAPLRYLPPTKHRIGRTALEVTRLGMGCAPLGDLFELLPDAQAIAAIDAAYAGGIRFFDTAPWYGTGKSELRAGFGLRGKSDAVVATKVGRVLTRGGSLDPSRRWKGGLPFGVNFDYTYAGIMRSFEDSLQRLGMPKVHALAIHDLDLLYHGTWEAVYARLDELDHGGGHRALRELAAARDTVAIGAGINRTGLIPKFLERFELDYFIVAMPYTLLSQEGLDELDLCRQRGVSVIIGAPFASGLLVSGSARPTTYDYAAAPPEMVARTAQLEAVCAEYAVPLPAAALQFVLAHPAVAAVIPGYNSPAQAEGCLAWLQTPIPAAFWQALQTQSLIAPGAPVPE